MCGGGLVATATMNEVGFFAEFMAWVKRNPVWSIPANPKVLGGYAEFVRLSNLSELATIYYDRKAIENLRNNSPLKAISEPRSLPTEIKGKSIQMLSFAMNPCDL